MSTAELSRSATEPRFATIKRAHLTPRAARITAPLLFLIGWQLIAPLIPSRILPMPADVAEAMWEQLVDGTMVEAFSVSILRLATGFAVALVIGAVVGLAMGVSTRVEAFLHDFVIVGLTFPYLIWGLLVAMVRFEGRGPLVVVFIAALPYVILNMSGVRRLEGARDGDALRRAERPRAPPPDPAVAQPALLRSLRYGLANGWKGWCWPRCSLRRREPGT
jgi:NitT/TauT family transport system permease protein